MLTPAQHKHRKQEKTCILSFFRCTQLLSALYSDQMKPDKHFIQLWLSVLPPNISQYQNKKYIFWYYVFLSLCSMSVPLWCVRLFLIGHTLLLNASWAAVQRQWGAGQSLGSAVGFLCSAGSGRIHWESAGSASGRSKCVLPLNQSECDSAGLFHCAWNACKF